MLSSSRAKIHEPLVTGVSPRPTDQRGGTNHWSPACPRAPRTSAAAGKLRNTRGCDVVGHRPTAGCDVVGHRPPSVQRHHCWDPTADADHRPVLGTTL